jgi:hypothetical protein
MISIEEAKAVLATLEKSALHDSAFGDTEVTWYDPEPIAGPFDRQEDIPEDVFPTEGCEWEIHDCGDGKVHLRRVRAGAYISREPLGGMSIDDEDGNIIFETKEMAVMQDLVQYAKKSVVGENSSVPTEEQQHLTLAHLRKTEQPDVDLDPANLAVATAVLGDSVLRTDEPEDDLPSQIQPEDENLQDWAGPGVDDYDDAQEQEEDLARVMGIDGDPTKVQVSAKLHSFMDYWKGLKGKLTPEAYSAVCDMCGGIQQVIDQCGLPQMVKAEDPQ